MSKERIEHFIQTRMTEDGLQGIGLPGVKLFRTTTPIACAPAVYDPTIVAIVSGAKEAVLDGHRFVYDSQRYMCCPMSMPVEAGTPQASEQTPLLGVMITLDTRLMRELAIELEQAAGAIRPPKGDSVPQGLVLAPWDAAFGDALLRLLLLADTAADAAVLGHGRLRELYYAVLRGEAGFAARRAFGVGNEIARAIEYLSCHLNETVTIDDVASQVGMSRAVLHRKFKQATTMSPLQFMKSMRLNNAAMKIAGGMTVSEAASEVGYVSASQFSREFKRLYSQSPRQWSQSIDLPAGLA